MKKAIVAIVMSFGITAQAGIFDFFDFTKFFEGAIVIAEGINENLEKLRLKQQETLNIREQWDQACEVTTALNPTILEFNKLLAKHKVNQELCAPVTTVIKLQTDILARCSDYYNKPVPENAEYLLGKFALSVFQSKMILTKCYPELAKVKIPGLPGGN